MNKYNLKSRFLFAAGVVAAGLIVVFSAQPARAESPYIQNVFFGQDEQGDYISFDWVGVPPADQTVEGWLRPYSKDMVLIWFNRFNPYGTTEGVRFPSVDGYDFPNGDFVQRNAWYGGNGYSGFGNAAFASGNPYEGYAWGGEPDLSKTLPRAIKTYINPNWSPERISFSMEDFITIQLSRYIPYQGAKLLVNDSEQYFYQVPSNPLPAIPYTNVKFGFDENDLLKVSFDWVGPSRDILPLIGFNGRISYPFYARFDSDPEKDISMNWESGHNQNLYNVSWFTWPGLTAQKGQHYDLFVKELHKWKPSNELRVCNWWYPCPVNRTLTESVLGRSFKPDDYITIAFHSSGYVLNDPNKYYYFEVPVIPIPDEVMNAENIYYNTLKSDLKETTFIYSEMVVQKTIETTFSLIEKALTQSWTEIAKLDEAAQLREATKKVALNVFGKDLVKELQKKVTYPVDVTTNIVADVLENGLLLETHSGEPFQEVVDNIHNRFVATTLNTSPQNEAIESSVERLGHLNNLAEKTSYEAEALRRKFDLLEEIKNNLGAYNLFVRLGGNFAEIRSEKGKNVGAGILALATSQAFSTVKSVVSFDQWLALMDWYGELWLVEDRATKLFRKGIEGTVHVLNTGEFPVVAVDMVREFVPETVALGSIGTFGGVLKNTGGETIEARLKVTITEPALFLEGEPRIFTTETIQLSPNSEETPFIIDVPFFGGLPLVSTGEATAQTTVEYGILGLEYSAENAQKTFEITHNLFPILKTVRTNLDGSLGDTLINIYIANNESEPKTFTVVDEIPKSLSPDLSNVIFSTPPDRIVNPDPVVAWDIELAPGELAILTYKIASGEIDNVFSFPRAEIVGDVNKQSLLTVIGEEDAQVLGGDSLNFLIKAAESAPVSAFENENARNALIAKVKEVIEKAQNQEFTDALNKLLHDVRPKMDGRKSPKDWIIEEDTRLTLVALVDNAIVFFGAIPQN